MQAELEALQKLYALRIRIANDHATMGRYLLHYHDHSTHSRTDRDGLRTQSVELDLVRRPHRDVTFQHRCNAQYHGAARRQKEPRTAAPSRVVRPQLHPTKNLSSARLRWDLDQSIVPHPDHPAWKCLW